MALWNNDTPVRPLPNTTSRSAAASTLMLIDALRTLASKQACNAIYAALADKKDIKAEDLEELGNKLGRLAWELTRK